MHTLAKRVHNLAPRPTTLAVEGGETVRIEVDSSEFFGDAFQAEATGADGTTYRLVSDGTDDPPAIARERADSDGWELLGEVAAVRGEE